MSFTLERHTVGTKRLDLVVSDMVGFFGAFYVLLLCNSCRCRVTGMDKSSSKPLRFLEQDHGSNGDQNHYADCNRQDSFGFIRARAL